jgi:hypothetical protein
LFLHTYELMENNNLKIDAQNWTTWTYEAPIIEQTSWKHCSTSSWGLLSSRNIHRIDRMIILKNQKKRPVGWTHVYFSESVHPKSCKLNINMNYFRIIHHQGLSNLLDMWIIYWYILGKNQLIISPIDVQLTNDDKAMVNFWLTFV